MALRFFLGLVLLRRQRSTGTNGRNPIAITGVKQSYSGWRSHRIMVIFGRICRRGSVVEQLFRKQQVTSSNLVVGSVILG